MSKIGGNRSGLAAFCLNFRNSGIEFLLSTAQQYHGGAGPGQRMCLLASYAGAGPGYQGYLAINAEVRDG